MLAACLLGTLCSFAALDLKAMALRHYVDIIKPIGFVSFGGESEYRTYKVGHGSALNAPLLQKSLGTKTN
jgi:hypothetical protein